MSETITTINAAPCSIEISRNASGGVSFACKTYAETLDKAIEEAKAAYFKLDQEFPAVRK